jgi:S-adenosylmethionine:tRNA ribosyltransferase-isomerase
VIGPAITPLDLAVPEQATAAAPLERRGGRRDGVRLMVADVGADTISHITFDRIGEALRPGDVLVINVSATVPASVDGTMGSDAVRIHLSSPIAGNLWTAEPRRPAGVGSKPWPGFGGGTVSLPAGAQAVFLAPDARSSRLWIVELRKVGDPADYLNRHGSPIRYSHAEEAWPLFDYQTVYAVEPGSAEMPSAGRPFTTRLLTSLLASGVLVVPVVLHAGVASFEAGERPDAERFRVPEATARVVNQARAAGGRSIAVGTTSVRAIETVTDTSGIVHPGAGVTDLVVTPERGVGGVDGIVTGWHEAGGSHLSLVDAVGERDLITRCYREAVERGYLWHEFGDSLLVLSR